jgi:hypothetical protein
MTCRILLLPLLLSLYVCSKAQSQPVEIEASAGFKVERVVSYKGAQAFTWDNHGQVWVLSDSQNRLIVSTMPNFETGEIQPLRSFQKLGNGRSTLLVSGNIVFVSDGAAIRVFPVNGSKSDGTLYVPPASLFPAYLEISSLAWSPLGYIYFLYHSPVSQLNGIGRVNLQGTQWDVAVKGTFTNLAFDLNGFAITADATSKNLFRVAPGLDYDRGLETYKKADLALKVDKRGLEPSFATIYSGSAWPSVNRGTWLVFDRADSTLEQFKEEEGGLKHWRTVARLDTHSTLRDIQVGPDGAAWILVEPSNKLNSARHSAIFRLETIEPGNQARAFQDISLHSTENLVAEFANLNSWQRDAALRILDNREELRTTRGLHPGTPLHKAFGEKTNSSIARVYAILSLHRLGLLDETLLENAADDDDPLVRAWAVLLLGERNYPTEVAFDKLYKLAKETNVVARSISAIAARQFVSGSMTIDTPPRAMPLREVFTGGILSTLWFSTKNGSTPEFDLLFWNAVRPITAFDPAHPMGFFNGDSDAKLSLAYWIVGLITRQIAETEDLLKQEDGMIMVGKLKPENPRMILAALRGLKNGTPSRKVMPTERSLQVLTDFAQSKNPEIASLSEEIRREWQTPFK